MNDSAFHKFINLIDFDQKLHSKELIVQKSELEVDSLKQEIDELSINLGKIKHVFVEAQKYVDLKELEMKVLDQAIEERKGKLENADYVKVYSSLQNEIEKLKKNQFDYESILMDAWNSLENAKKEYDQKKQEYDAKITDLNSGIEEKKQIIESTNNELAELYKQRPDMEASIPAEWLQKYKMMRNTVVNPVVPVENGICSACFYKIRNQDIIDLKRKKLLQCRDCYRFLYIKDEA